MDDEYGIKKMFSKVIVLQRPRVIIEIIRIKNFFFHF